MSLDDIICQYNILVCILWIVLKGKTIMFFHANYIILEVRFGHLLICNTCFLRFFSKLSFLRIQGSMLKLWSTRTSASLSGMSGVRTRYINNIWCALKLNCFYSTCNVWFSSISHIISNTLWNNIGIVFIVPAMYDVPVSRT